MSIPSSVAGLGTSSFPATHAATTVSAMKPGIWDYLQSSFCRRRIFVRLDEMDVMLWKAGLRYRKRGLSSLARAGRRHVSPAAAAMRCKAFRNCKRAHVESCAAVVAAHLVPCDVSNISRCFTALSRRWPSQTAPKKSGAVLRAQRCSDCADYGLQA